MRVRSSTSLVGALAALVVVAACADAPVEPASRLAPRGPSADLLGNLLGTPGDTVIGGVTFAKIESRANGWMETFNVNVWPEKDAPAPGWLKAPAPWLPESLQPTDWTASNFVAPGDLVRQKPNTLTEWAVVKQARDRANWYVPESMIAWHEAGTCNAPPLTHEVASYDEAPFLCRNHMMTAVNSSGYGVTYLTPNRLVRYSGLNAAVVRFDVTSERTSARDWIDLWVTPYDDNLVVPLDDSLPDVQGHPANGLHVRMAGPPGATRFEAAWIINHKAYRITPASTKGYEQAFDEYQKADPANRPEAAGRTSAVRRDTFELRFELGRLKFGMPRYDLWWIDEPVLQVNVGASGLLAVQLGHHSFAPATAGTGPDTWHWDNIGMAPAVPFSIITADRRYVDQSSAAAVTLRRAVPNASKLRFAGYGSKFEVRFNGAGPWKGAKKQDEQRNVDGRFHSYWTDVPAGTTRVEFRASNDPTDKKSPTPIWMARDITVWSLNP